MAAQVIGLCIAAFCLLCNDIVAFLSSTWLVNELPPGILSLLLLPSTNQPLLPTSNGVHGQIP